MGTPPNAYVKADKKAHSKIMLQVPQLMSYNEDTLNTLVASNEKYVTLEVQKNLSCLK